MTKNTTSIDLNHITKTYPFGGAFSDASNQKVIALNDVNLSIGSGEIYGLVGESGSGKTTIGRLITRLEKPDNGIIKVEGEPIAKLRGRSLKTFRRRVQMIFQDPYQSLNPYLSVIDTVAEPLIIHRKSAVTNIRTKVILTLEMVGLSPAIEFMHRYPHQLSGGQRQRVAIARAIVLDPRVMVADEPTSMLDASISVQIYQILANIQQRKQMTLLFITHSLAAAHYLCDRIAVIYRGHIVETGPAKTIISKPCHPYTQALLDALPKFGHLWEKKRFNTLRAQARSDENRQGCPFFNRCKRGDENLCRDNRPDGIDLGDNHQSACFFSDEIKTSNFS
jgi:oligopeptide/dipeptide ABC transporter ATP-binding protein